MTETLEDTYSRYDEQEQLCQQALERRDAARTPIGHFIMNRVLAYRQWQLESLSEEAETGEFRAIHPSE